MSCVRCFSDNGPYFCLAGFLPRCIQMISAKQKAKLRPTRMKMYHSQNLLVKSAMVFLPAMGGQVQVFGRSRRRASRDTSTSLCVVLERQARGGVKRALALLAPGPRHSCRG